MASFEQIVRFHHPGLGLGRRVFSTIPQLLAPGETQPGDLFFDPKTYRTYEVTNEYTWRDVSLLYPVNDYEDYKIRAQNLWRNIPNYLPKPLPPLETTEDAEYTILPVERATTLTAAQSAKALPAGPAPDGN